MLEIVKDEAYWLEWQLENWARWMRSDERPEGLPDRACGGLQNYTTMYGDFDISCEIMDCDLAEATNAAIEGLEVHEQCAIYVAYKVMAVYRMRDYETSLITGKAKVLQSLKRRGIWVG